MDKTICELFAGVGGFRLGFERLNSGWNTVWFSQYEPKAKKQWAHECYVKHYGDSVDVNGEFHTNEDISTIDKNTIPNHTLLVGGFPCQDYSVAQSLSSSKGIEGKKGVLWWQIRDTLIAKRPPFCIFENVDRLLQSPAKQRGRDFGIMLSCFNELGYNVEWRVVNAAKYGAAQKRKRAFIFAYHNSTNYAKQMNKYHYEDVISKIGFMASAFPISAFITPIAEHDVEIDIAKASETFKFSFRDAGYMYDKKIYTTTVIEKQETPICLSNIIQDNVDEKYYVPDDKIEKWKYLKGSKKIPRVSSDGYEYIYTEGAMAFPDNLQKPGRTMLTSEGTVNRSSHIILDKNTNRLRTLTPVECERLNGFDDEWTNTGMSDRMRYFCMGNALVVPMITRMGTVLDDIIACE